MERVGAVVVGGGALGLSVARALTLRGLTCMVLERNDLCGQETSSRNSGVLHSGIYYPQNSSKASLCLRGSKLLLEYLRTRKLAHSICGKLIVAQMHELPKLQMLFQNGQRNQVQDLEMWTADQAKAAEPAVSCAGAIWSPNTGIFDTHAVIQSFENDILENPIGSSVVTNCSFLHAKVEESSFRVETTLGEVQCEWLINCAGLGAWNVARSIRGLDPQRIPPAYFAKGNYFKLSGRKPFQHLVYPLPAVGGLGIHSTLDLSGNVRFGPDVQWLETPTSCGDESRSFHYDVDESRKADFICAIEAYWPAVRDSVEHIHPDYAGIRPKLRLDNSGDFLIQTQAEHAVPNLVQLLGIESPGWTSCMAIAENVAQRVMGGEYYNAAPMHSHDASSR